MHKQLEKIYVQEKNIWGEPQVYKSVAFYPIKIKDAESQLLFYQVFQFPKRYISDKEVVKASYLKFLIYFVQHSVNPEGTEMMDKIKRALKLLTKEDDIELTFETLQFENLSPLEKLMINIRIGDKIFNENDFDAIRELVLMQNGMSLEYIEQFNPDLEKSLAFANKEFSDLTFEDEVWIFCSLMRKTIFEVENYTLYQFKKQFERIMILYNFELYSPLEVSGQIKSKTGAKIVDHYITHMTEKGRYDSILIAKEQFLMENPEIPDELGKAIGFAKNK